MRPCEMIVGWKVDPSTDGELGDEIVCGKPATHLVEGEPACDECAASCREEALDVHPLSRVAEKPTAMSYCAKHDLYYERVSIDATCPQCSHDGVAVLAAQVASLTAENAETRVVLRQFYGADEPISSADIARKMLAEIASLRAEVARWRENAETADEILDCERRESRADLTRVLRETAAENERLRADCRQARDERDAQTGHAMELIDQLHEMMAEHDALRLDLARVTEERDKAYKQRDRLNDLSIKRMHEINALRAKLAALRVVVEWFVGEFHCPEIHVTYDNHPGRCPEASDDPDEYCASARFQRALAASEEE